MYRVAYWEYPENVIWIDLPQRRLQGFDNYWIAWPRYGMWQDAENIGTMYSADGPHAVAFEDKGHYEVEIDPFPIPTTAVWFRGHMLTDEQARFVGLI